MKHSGGNWKKKIFYFLGVFVIALIVLINIFDAQKFSTKADANKVLDGGNINVPNHYKTLENNRDGTFTLELSVEGAIQPEQKTARANVLIVYDVSGSMSNNNSYVYAVNPLGNYRRANNGTYAQLRNCNNGNQVPQGYQYDVCYYEGNRLVPYDGTRYIYTTRAAASEKAVRDFATQLYEFNQPKEEGGELQDNIQMSLITFSSDSYINQWGGTSYRPGDENTAAHLEQGWTNDPDDFNSHLSATGYNNSRVLSYGGGTNWEAALQAAYNYLNSKDTSGNYVTDADPTYVLFVTDGSPTYGINTGNGSSGYLDHYEEAQDQSLLVHNYNTATHSAGTEDNPSNTMLYGIFTFGSSNNDNPNYLDDLIYYAHNNGNMGTRTAGVGSNSDGIEEVYFNASNSESLNEAIDTILNAIVDAVGVTEVSIVDGTTNEAKLSSGEVAPLLTVDESTYKYWMSKDVYPYDPMNTDPDMENGKDYDYYTDRIDRNTGKKFYVYTKDLGNGKLQVSWTRPSEPDDHHTIKVTGTIEKTRDPHAEDPDQLVMRVQWKKHCTATTNDEGTDDCGYSPQIFFNQDPPQAYLDETGTVQWDLSSAGTLLNGVTYSVSFDVWKTQMVFDLIADLNNGLVQPNELEDGYIDPDTGTYGKYAGLEEYVYFDSTSHACENPEGCWRLRTNTTAELNYKDTREGDNPDEHESGYTNPDGIEVFSDTITIEKDWKNYLDVADKELPDSVDVQLLIDGEPYLTTSLTKVNEWKTPEDDPIFISYGIMRVNEETGAVEILDNTPGHDYSFTEIDDEHYNYQLVSETVHPMIYSDNSIKGEKVRLVKVDANMTGNFTLEDDPLEDYQIPETMKNDPNLQFAISERGNKFVRLVKGGPVYFVRRATSAKLNAINYRRSNLNVYKVVDGTAPADSLYKFNITVNDPGNTEVQNDQLVPANLYFSVWDNEKKGYVDLGERLTATGWDKEIKDGAWTGYYHGPNGSTISVQLKSTENLRFVNLTTQAEYTVTEDLSGNSDFRFVDGKVSGTHKDSEGNNVELTGDYIENTVTKAEKKVTGKIKLTNSNYYVEMQNVYELTELPIEKIWDDNDDQDGIRPDSITVNLLADGEIEQENVVLNPAENENVTIDENGNWHYTFSGLTRFKEVTQDGELTYEEIDYTVEEVNDDVITGTDGVGTYSSSINDAGNTITNTHTPEVTTVPVKKVWEDKNNQDGLRGSVTFNLYGIDKTTPINSHTFDLNSNECSNNECNYTFTKDNKDVDLPKYNDGTEIEYTVEEVFDSNYYESSDPTKDKDGNVVITNTHNPFETEISVLKIWNDDKNRDNARQNIVVSISARDFPLLRENITLREDNNWTDKWEHLQKFNGGNPIEYTVTEITNLQGYTSSGPVKITPDETDKYQNNTVEYQITNNRVFDTVEIPVKKVWDDNNDQDGIRDQEEITFELYGVDKTTPVNTYTFETNDCPNNECTYTFTKDSTGAALPKYESGKVGEEINYTIKETGVSDEYTPSDVEKVEGTLVITNTHTPEKTTVPVKKVWNDNNNQDGKREFVTFELYGVNNTKLNEYTFTKEDCSGNTCEYTFTKDSTGADLPKYSEGEEINYTVKETGKPNGYEITSQSKENGVLVITNTYEPEVTTVPVKKIWNDNNNQDGKREFVTFELYGANNQKVNEYTFTEDDCSGNTCEYTFTTDSDGVNLPKYNDGDVIDYTIKETGKPAVYTASDVDKLGDGTLVITNTHEPEKTKVPVKKVWNDNNNQDGKREFVTFELYGANNTKVNEYTFTKEDCSGNTCEYTFTKDSDGTDLPKYNDGKEINYTIKETGKPDVYQMSGPTKENGVLVITNTHEPELINIEVTKIWDDNNNQDGFRPAKITINVLDGNIVVDSQEIEGSATGRTWSFKSKDLPKYNDGVEIDYTVSEEFTTTPENAYEKGQPSGSVAKGFTITNTHEPEVTTVPVKKVWNDNNNQDGKREFVTFELYGANNQKVNEYTFTEDDCSRNTCEYTFTKDSDGSDLPKYNDGEVIDYTIKETGKPDVYQMSGPTKENGVLVITNTHEPEKTTVPVKKVWNDNNNQDGLRNNVTFELYGANNQKVNEYTFTKEDCSGNTCEYTFTTNSDGVALPKYSEGKVIDYTIKETGKPDGYEMTGPTKENGVLVITNAHTPEDTNVTVEKVWEDDNNSQNTRPESIELTLYAGDKIADVDDATVTVTGRDWKYTWKGLDKKADGKVIKYTVKEKAVENYTTKYSEKDGVLIVTNTVDDLSKNIPVKKIWEDASNQDGIRPTTLTITLTGTVESEEEPVYTDSVTLNGKTDEWRGEFKNAPIFYKGKLIEYSVSEPRINDYTVDEENTNRTNESDFKFTNTYEPEVTTVPVKKVWEDKSNQDGLRGSVTFNLYGVSKDTPVASHTFTESECANNVCSYTFTTDNNNVKLPKKANGEVINYTVEEVFDSNYYESSDPTKDKDGNVVITNTHNPFETEISVLKIWNDDKNRDNARQNIVVSISAGDFPLLRENITLRDSNQWTDKWDHLQKFNGGKPIEYTVTEITNLQGYTSSGPVKITPDETDKYQNNTVEYQITNNRVFDKVEIPVKKIWDDNNDQDGIRDQEEITFELYGVDKTTPVNTYTFESNDCPNNECTYTFTKDSTGAALPKYESGKVGEEINYTIKETGVSDEYTPSEVENVDGTLVITNTHTPEVITVPGTKTWEDNGNQDGIRPGTITVYIKDGDTIVDTITDVTGKSTDKTWSFTSKELPKYRNGEEIVYTVDEELPAGYTKKVDGNNIINTHVTETTTVKGTKVWDDANNQDGKRPSSITIYVKDGDTTVDTIELSGDETADSWTFESKELPKYKAEGKEIKYTVEEEVKGVTDIGYSISIDGTTIKNSRTPEVIEELPITKTWVDNSNSEKFRPNSVTIQLLGDNKEVEKVTVGLDENGRALEGTTVEGNNWKYVFKNLPKYANGKEIEYKVVELNIDANYKAEYPNNRTIVNTIDAMKKDIPVKKLWDDASDQDGYRPDSIEFTLTGTVESEEKPVYTDIITLNGDADTWESKFKDAPIFYKGTLITYTINEVVTKDLTKYYPETSSKTVDGIYTITNKHTPEVTEVTIGKTWDDKDDQDGKRPQSIEVTLTGNGISYGPVRIGLDENGNPLEGTTVEGNTWKYTFANLPKKANGEDINYVVSESNVDNYNQLSIINNVITNQHTPATISYEVVKEWQDYDNQDGKRPEFITVTLTGKVGDTVVYTNTINVKPDENGDWKYSFTGLNKYYKKQLIQYTLTEGNVDLYETDPIVDKPNEEGTVSISNKIINKHELETIDITVKKVWDDLDNKYNHRTTFVTVHLFADGIEVDKTMLTEANGWTTVFEGLVKYREGKVGEEIEYTIKEDAVEYYKTSIAESDNVFTITNTYDGPTESEIVPPKTGILPTKDYTFFELLMNLILLSYSLVYLKKVED